MNKLYLTALMLALSGCIGTELANREYEKDKPYPDLHSVPDRPPETDFAKVDQKMVKEEAEQEQMLKFNAQWRKKYGK